MNILFVSQVFNPEQNPANDEVEFLANLGHKVTVLTGLPNYPQGKIYKGYFFKRKQKLSNGVVIYRSFSIPRRHNKFCLFLNYITFAFFATLKVMFIRGNFDFVFVQQGSPVSQIQPAIFAKRKFKCPIICYCCDLWPESLKAGGLSEGLAFSIIGSLSKRWYQKCDFIFTVAPSFIEYNHITNGIAFNKMAFLPQGANDEFADMKDLSKKENGFIDFLFAGNIGGVQNIPLIIEAFSLSKNKKTRLFLVGDGSFVKQAKQKTKSLNMENRILFFGKHPKTEMPHFFSMVDVCVLALSGTSAIGKTIPSKLTEYMASGKPILASIGGDAAKLIEQANCGIVVPPDNAVLFADAIDYSVSNLVELRKKGFNGRGFYLSNATLNIWSAKVLEIGSYLIKQHSSKF